MEELSRKISLTIGNRDWRILHAVFSLKTPCSQYRGVTWNFIGEGDLEPF
jgi:hypothetical protein